MIIFYLLSCFFSSRRRHTRSTRDWSSDVCSSDLIYGGGQETGRRAGTENIAFMVALGAAAVIAYEQIGLSQPHLQRLRDHLQQRLEAELPGIVHLNGHPTERLPNTLNISIDGVIGE